MLILVLLMSSSSCCSPFIPQSSEGLLTSSMLMHSVYLSSVELCSSKLTVESHFRPLLPGTADCGLTLLCFFFSVLNSLGLRFSMLVWLVRAYMVYLKEWSLTSVKFLLSRSPIWQNGLSQTIGWSASSDWRIFAVWLSQSGVLYS